VPVLLYKLYGARTILNTIIQSLTPHNSMLNMSLVRHSVTALGLAQGYTVLDRSQVPHSLGFCAPPLRFLCAYFANPFADISIIACTFILLINERMVLR